jgi:membrane-associated phospholipid phosphatase
MGSAIAYGMLICLLFLCFQRGWLRHLAAGALVVLVLAIGFSRMLLGAHWASDVLGGFAAGAVVVAVFVTVAVTVPWGRRPTGSKS